MVCCAIIGCTNHNRDHKELGLIFHRFPKGSLKIQSWLEVCKSKTLSCASARVCSAHFCDSDYVRDLQHEVLNLPLRRFLKPDAVPHLNINYSSSVAGRQRGGKDGEATYHKSSANKVVAHF